MKSSRKTGLVGAAVSILAAVCLPAVVGCSSRSAEVVSDAKEQPLKATVHNEIAQAACLAEHLPAAFCARVGVANQNVDAREWDSLGAHAMPANGQTRCAAAGVAIERLRTLGAEVHTALMSAEVNETVVNRLADSLGRALHTIGDNCAHTGMTNPQHAWHTLKENCGTTGQDPDTAPAAIRCGTEETEAVFAGFVRTLERIEYDRDHLGLATASTAESATRGNACEFLRESDTWDGVDTRWNNGVTVPAFRGELLGAIAGDDAAARDLCASGADALAVPEPRARVNVAGGAWCYSIRLFCTGTGQVTSSEPPPHHC